tara:strand:+ start:667 stop:783 length:117 start_codon:yes stop_codon:yes gene_type:complete
MDNGMEDLTVAQALLFDAGVEEEEEEREGEYSTKCPPH